MCIRDSLRTIPFSSSLRNSRSSLAGWLSQLEFDVVHVDWMSRCLTSVALFLESVLRPRFKITSDVYKRQVLHMNSKRTEMHDKPSAFILCVLIRHEAFGSIEK